MGIKYSGTITFDADEWKLIRACPHCNAQAHRYEMRLESRLLCEACDGGFQTETFLTTALLKEYIGKLPETT